MAEIRNGYKVLVGNPEGKEYSEVLRVVEGVILKRILRKCGGRMCTCVIWFSIWTVGGLLKYDNGYWGPSKCGIFFFTK
jgi:hypothetical protein